MTEQAIADWNWLKETFAVTLEYTHDPLYCVFLVSEYGSELRFQGASEAEVLAKAVEGAKEHLAAGTVA